MKKILGTFAVIAAVAALSSCASKGDNVEPDYSAFSYAAAVQYGEYLAAMQTNFDVKIDSRAVAQAIEDALEGNLKMNGADANVFMNDFLDITLPAYRSYNAQQFIAKAAAKHGNVQSPSGVVYRIVKEGKGAKPAPADNVTLTCRCTLMDGTAVEGFGSERQTLNMDNLPAGIAEGVQMLGEGGEIKLWIPCEMAYGLDGNQSLGVGAYQPLYVEVSLHRIN